MNGEDNRFFNLLDNDPNLDIYYNERQLGQRGDDFPYAMGQSHDEESPIDILLFKAQGETIKKVEEGSDRNNGRMIIEEQEKRLQTKKKMKNTYAAKIKDLMHGQAKAEPISSMLEQGGSGSSSGGINPHNERRNNSEVVQKEDKLMKNRISAQKSRQIKKQYMEILEDKVKSLEAELADARRINQSNAEIVKKYCQNQTIIQGYIVTKQQVFDRLEKLVESKGTIDEESINMQIDSLRFRFGATGKERISLIDYYLKQICDLLIPDVHKYTLYSAEQAVDIFSDQGALQQCSEMFRLINLSHKDRSKINEKFRKQLHNQLEGIKKLFQELFQIKSKLEDQIRQTENTFDEIRKLIPPIGLSRFLLCLEKNKYRKDAAKIWKFWDEVRGFLAQVIAEHMDKGNQKIRKQAKKSDDDA